MLERAFARSEEVYVVNFPSEPVKALLEQAQIKTILFALGSLESAEGQGRAITWFNNESQRVFPKVDREALRATLTSLLHGGEVVQENDVFYLTKDGAALLHKVRKARPELQEPARPKSG